MTKIDDRNRADYQKARATTKHERNRSSAIESKLQAIMDWAEENSNFDTEFVDSLYEQFINRGELSESQIEALDNIIDKWGIDA